MPIQPKNKLPGRNELCPCGSGLKVKKCHGDPLKVAVCNRAVNEKMAQLIREEQKKQGLVPYKFTCNSCGKGFDEPKQAQVVPYSDICPKCNSTDIQENE